MNSTTFSKANVYEESGLPELGFRNYWYPVFAAWRLKTRQPKAIRILGEEIVLFRNKEKTFALNNQCAHRGAKLSEGSCLYPDTNTLTCPYHGWTYSGETGKCIAKLMEGPKTNIPVEARVKTYPVREHLGIIWLFIGDMAAVPLEEDLPECLSNTHEWHTIATWRTYKCNWRPLNDNLCYDLHAPFLHRNSPELVFQPIFPFASKVTTTELEDGKGLGYTAREGITEADYPNLGKFPSPSEAFWRKLKPIGRGQELNPKTSRATKLYGIKYRHMSRLPTVTLVGRPSGDYFMCRWVTPIDSKKTLFYSVNAYRRHSKITTLLDRIRWTLWHSWAHDWVFSDQDKKIVEGVRSDREQLSRSDAGVIAWRKFMVENARHPNDGSKSKL